MNLTVFHKTVYKYSEAVFLNPHHLYFTPQQRQYLKCGKHHLEIDPVPDGSSMRVDAEGNQYIQAWWNDMTGHLEITLEAEIETQPFNPYQFFVESAPAQSDPALEVYLKAVSGVSPALLKWSEQLSSAHTPGLPLILAITQEIHEKWEYSSRHEIGIMEVNHCFESRSGSCRDLSWLMIVVLRQLGIPARFVSGYTFSPESGQDHELHAWVEAWLPGGGWISADPSLGLLADESYVPIVSSYDPARTHPVQGIYAGSATSSMSYEVRVEQTSAYPLPI